MNAIRLHVSLLAQADGDALVRAFTSSDFLGEQGSSTTVGIGVACLIAVGALGSCFPRILIAFAFLRHALGAKDVPPRFVVFGLAALLSAIIMTPVWKESHRIAVEIARAEPAVSADVLVSRASAPIKRYLLTQTLAHDRDALRLFLRLDAQGDSSSADARVPEDVDLLVLLPAFLTSELRVAFEVGFLIFLPFVMIDLLVVGVLSSLGMTMLSPRTIALPLKVLVFVLADGWKLLVTQLAAGVV
jgi:flagellar biosynthetic protein FliP